MVFPLSLAYGLGVLHLLGLASVVLTHMSEGSRLQTLSQSAFWGLLMLVGGVTVVATSAALWWWPFCAVTLGVMVVGAMLDGRAPQVTI